MKRTVDDVLNLFKEKHGDKYEYIILDSKVESSMVVICKKHGEFKQKVKKHLEGQGCKKCAGEASSQKWKNPTGFRVDGVQVQLPLYAVWRAMQQRCKPQYWVERKHYSGTSCSESFNSWDYFYEWAVIQVGYGCFDDKGKPFELDKDLLGEDNKVYSEDTCCFIPRELNQALAMNQTEKVVDLADKYKNLLSLQVLNKLRGN